MALSRERKLAGPINTWKALWKWTHVSGRLPSYSKVAILPPISGASLEGVRDSLTFTTPGLADGGRWHRREREPYRVCQILRINSKWTVIPGVTYGTGPIISKAYIEWTSRKVFAEYSDRYPSCHRTFRGDHLLQYSCTRILVSTLIVGMCGRFDLHLWCPGRCGDNRSAASLP